MHGLVHVVVKSHIILEDKTVYLESLGVLAEHTI